jgi:SEC-C motif
MHPTTNNPHGSTGPVTEAGKDRSSRNATKNGLFSASDLILDSETEEYVRTKTALYTQLSPEGVLEEIFVTEIMTATWRLRRCRILEQDITAELPPADQTSIDRARARSHNILRRSMAELRKLQTERTIRLQLNDLEIPGLADSKQVLVILALHNKQHLDSRKSADLDTLEGLMAQADKELGMQTSQGSSFCEEPEPAPAATPDPETLFCKTDATPRNALCPCGSGTKYKRCCGTAAPPVLNMAA